MFHKKNQLDKIKNLGQIQLTKIQCIIFFIFQISSDTSCFSNSSASLNSQDDLSAGNATNLPCFFPQIVVPHGSQRGFVYSNVKSKNVQISSRQVLVRKVSTELLLLFTVCLQFILPLDTFTMISSHLFLLFKWLNQSWLNLSAEYFLSGQQHQIGCKVCQSHTGSKTQGLRLNPTWTRHIYSYMYMWSVPLKKILPSTSSEYGDNPLIWTKKSSSL